MKNEATISTDWKGLCEKLAPSKSPQSRRTLRAGIRLNAYIGLIRQPNGTVTNFVVKNTDMSGDIRSMVRRDPALESKLVDAYRVDFVEWDSSFTEATSNR